MKHIPIYPMDCTDFSGNGLGLLTPSACRVEERANGLYELTLEMPIAQDGRFRLMQIGRVVKAACPVSPQPLYTYWEGANEALPERQIYAVSPAGGLRLYSRPTSSSASLGRYAQSTEVLLLNADHARYDLVQALPDGAVGYMRRDSLSYSRTLPAQSGASGTVVAVSPA
ncbi:MAG: hypothetical protein IJ074_13420, partial [Clostridia bacterium]|nr:hypothetical protein [Clostridia bacterium]